MAQVGAQELRTDEHSVYEGIAPEEHHQLCLTHWRKSKALFLRGQAGTCDLRQVI